MRMKHLTLTAIAVCTLSVISMVASLNSIDRSQVLSDLHSGNLQISDADQSLNSTPQTTEETNHALEGEV